MSEKRLNLMAAFAGESQANKYLAFAKSGGEGKLNAAKLFRRQLMQNTSCNEELELAGKLIPPKKIKRCNGGRNTQAKKCTRNL